MVDHSKEYLSTKKPGTTLVHLPCVSLSHGESDLDQPKQSDLNAKR